MISVVMGTFNRAHLLERSLECYTQQTFQDFELVIIDDDSTDNTNTLCAVAARHMNLVYIRLAKPQGITWRDSASIINMGIRAARGSFVIATHPEVMPGKDLLRQVNENAADRRYVAAKAYYLTPDQQWHLDMLDWRHEPLTTVRSLPGFYDVPSAEFTGCKDYMPFSVDKATVWESWLWGGLSKKTWRDIGGLGEFNAWGTVDVDFLNRRRLLKIPNVTLNHDDCICVHQNHDDLGSPRDMNLVVKTLPQYRNADEAILHNI